MKITMLSVLITVFSIIHVPGAAAGKPQAGVKCRAYSIVATEKKGKLPTDLMQFKHIFKDMPFKMFGSFRLNTQTSMVLGSKSSVARLSSKLSLHVQLLDRILSSRDKRRFRLQLQIKRKNPKNKKKLVTVYSMVMKLSSEKPMFIAGPKEGGGTLVVGLVCK
ncbi:hypothetical protein KKF84_08615 [Myxococcota bacterium]|nr:hypothetical protein [Myxococcota bacterium]